MSNNNIKNEVIQLLRNSNVISTTIRGVTTGTDTGTFAAAMDYTIDKTNVKNIRSIIVGSTTLVYGDDYFVDYDLLSTTVKCKISFNVAQTGTYTISYDYGTDKIFGDFPRDDLKISSYPRLSIDTISKTTDSFGIGGDTFISEMMLTCVVYSDNMDYIESVISLIESAIKTNAKKLYYFPYIKPIGQGPLIKSDDNVILHKNIDLMAMFNVSN